MPREDRSSRSARFGGLISVVGSPFTDANGEYLLHSFDKDTANFAALTEDDTTFPCIEENYNNSTSKDEILGEQQSTTNTSESNTSIFATPASDLIHINIFNASTPACEPLITPRKNFKNPLTFVESQLKLTLETTPTTRTTANMLPLTQDESRDIKRRENYNTQHASPSFTVAPFGLYSSEYK